MSYESQHIKEAFQESSGNDEMIRNTVSKNVDEMISEILNDPSYTNGRSLDFTIALLRVQERIRAVKTREELDRWSSALSYLEEMSVGRKEIPILREGEAKPEFPL